MTDSLDSVNHKEQAHKLFETMTRVMGDPKLLLRLGNELKMQSANLELGQATVDQLINKIIDFQINDLPVQAESRVDRDSDLDQGIVDAVLKMGFAAYQYVFPYWIAPSDDVAQHAVNHEQMMTFYENVRLSVSNPISLHALAERFIVLSQVEAPEDQLSLMTQMCNAAAENVQPFKLYAAMQRIAGRPRLLNKLAHRLGEIEPDEQARSMSQLLEIVEKIVPVQESASSILSTVSESLWSFLSFYEPDVDYQCVAREHDRQHLEFERVLAFYDNIKVCLSTEANLACLSVFLWHVSQLAKKENNPVLSIKLIHAVEIIAQGTYSTFAAENESIDEQRSFFSGIFLTFNNIFVNRYQDLKLLASKVEPTISDRITACQCIQRFLIEIQAQSRNEARISELEACIHALQVCILHYDALMCLDRDPLYGDTLQWLDGKVKSALLRTVIQIKDTTYPYLQENDSLAVAALKILNWFGMWVKSFFGKSSYAQVKRVKRYTTEFFATCSYEDSSRALKQNPLI